MLGLLPRIEEHLAKLADDPDNSASRHWMHETHGWIDQLEVVLSAVGDKTAAGWQDRIEMGGGFVSEIEMQPDPKLLRLLEKVYDSFQEEQRDELPAEEYDRRRFDFAFHMTDWLSDLKGYSKLVEEPGSFKTDDATHFLIGFLYHVVPHLNAAGRLLLDRIPDPFVEPQLAAAAG